MPFLQFPPTTGEYDVGQCDCMWQEPGEEGSTEEGKKMIVRIFYPVPKDANKTKKAAWLPSIYGAKCMSYAEAYAKFLWRPGVNSTVIGTLGFLPMMSNVMTQTYEGAPLAQPDRKLRPIIYSHGLGGSRSCYSAVCVDLASHGYFVIALEHSDGSASLNVLPDKTIVHHSFVPYKALIKPKEKRIPGGFTPSLVPKFTPKPMTQYEFRNTQLKQRVDEMRFVLRCLDKLNAGTHDEEVPVPDCLKDKVTGAFDMDKISLCGHSFGAATCISAAKVEPRFKVVICHDPWLFPLGMEETNGSFGCPTLILNADTFEVLWPEEGNKALCSLIEKSRKKGLETSCYSVLGTKHQDYSDFPLLAPQLTGSLGMSGATDPVDALNTVHAMGIAFMDHIFEKPAESLLTSVAKSAAKTLAGPEEESHFEPPEAVQEKVAVWDISRWGGAFDLEILLDSAGDASVYGGNFLELISSHLHGDSGSVGDEIGSPSFRNVIT